VSYFLTSAQRQAPPFRETVKDLDQPQESLVEAAQVNQLLPAADPHEDLIDEESVAVASVFSFQSARINGSEFDTPKSDCFSTDGDVSFGEEVFDISMAEVEAIIEPDGVGNDVRWESVALVCVHPSILSISTI
jgi:hypothetical protein